MMEHGQNSGRVYLDEAGFKLYLHSAGSRGQAVQPGGGLSARQEYHLAGGCQERCQRSPLPDIRARRNEGRRGHVCNNPVLHHRWRICHPILDNAPSHRGLQTPSPRHPLQVLPPYSKLLNPIENCFSVLKTSAKQRLAHIQTPCIPADYCCLGCWALTEKAVSEIYKHVLNLPFCLMDVQLRWWVTFMRWRIWRMTELAIKRWRCMAVLVTYTYLSFSIHYLCVFPTMWFEKDSHSCIHIRF